MTSDELDALQRLCDGATEAPWQVVRYRREPGIPLSVCVTADGLGCICEQTEGEPGDFNDGDVIGPIEADFAFIVAAREALPALLRRVRELEAEVEELVGENAKILGTKAG